MRFQPAAYGLALLVPAVILPFQAGTLLHHGAWAGGSSQVMGHVDQVRISRKTSVVDYSYVVNGKRYTGDVAGVVYAEGPKTVTYAKDDPAVSSLDPSRIAPTYITALVLAILSLLPLAIMFGLEIRSAILRTSARAR